MDRRAFGLGLTTDPATYDAWFRAEVQEALAEPLITPPGRTTAGDTFVVPRLDRLARSVPDARARTAATVLPA